METYLTKTGWWAIAKRHDHDHNKWIKKAVYCKECDITKVYEADTSDKEIIADLDSQPFQMKCARGVYTIQVKENTIIASYRSRDRKVFDTITAPAGTELIDFRDNVIDDKNRKTDLRIYIATPVTSRQEPTREKQFKSAKKQIKLLKEQLQEDVELCIYTRQVAGVDVCDLKDSEPKALGKCVQAVLESDAIYIDKGYEQSSGCNLELTAAKLYGKKIFYSKEGYSNVDDWIEKA